MRNVIIAISSLLVGGLIGYKASDQKIYLSLGGDQEGKDASGAITFETVKQYKDAYDNAPIFYKPNSTVVYKGFKIDAAGFNFLKSNPAFKEIYIRLGKKPDSTYTFMILPLDAYGNLIQNAPAQLGAPDVNYDNLEPCPDKCPVNFGNEHQ